MMIKLHTCLSMLSAKFDRISAIPLYVIMIQTWDKGLD